MVTRAVVVSARRRAPRIDAARFRADLDELVALSVVDLLLAATAAHHGLVVLHDDNDFVVGAHVLNDLAERNVHDTPAQGGEPGPR